MRRTIRLLLCLSFGIAHLHSAIAPPENRNPGLVYWCALMEMPNLSDKERALQDNFREAPLNAEYEALVRRYDVAFRLADKAAKMTNAPCEWGIDLNDGPDALLPNLAPAKALAKAAEMRARFFLERKDERRAISDLSTAFILGRQVGQDGILISALVQIAIENIVIATVAENFHRFSDQGLATLMTAFDGAPARATIARSLGYGERTLVAWYEKRIIAIRSRHSNESAAIAEVRELLAEKAAETKNYKVADRFLNAAGGKIDNLLALNRATGPLYDEIEKVASLDYDKFDAVHQSFFDKIERSTNPFVMTFFPALKNAQQKEFLVRSRIEKLRAAIQYRLHGKEALQNVRDPIGEGPFRFREVSFEGRTRGFELASPNPAHEPDRLIFIEKPGKPFQVIGIRAGEPFRKI